MSRSIQSFRLLLGLIVIGLLSGCGSMATRFGFYEPITAQVRADSLQTAVQSLETAREKNKFGEKDRLIYFIDAGMLNHYAENYEISNEKLTQAEQAADELFTKSVSKAMLSTVLNDNALDYSGEDYEILYTNLIKALNYAALDDHEDALVEIRRANLKLDLLKTKYADAAAVFREESRKDTSYIDFDYDVKEVHFYNDAFARWLSMHLYAADGKYDDARIDEEQLRQAFTLQPNVYDFTLPEVTYASDEGAILAVVALAGLAPNKQTLSLRLRTDKDLNLVQVLYDGPDTNQVEYAHFPAPINEDYYFKFAIPQLVDRFSDVGSVQLTIDGQPAGELNLIEDVNKVARETFDAKKSWVFIRTIARALAKGLAAHQLKEKADTGGLEGWLKKLAVDVATDLSENADLRSSQYLPGRIFVGDFVVPTGPHDLTIEFYSRTGHLMTTSTYQNYQVLEQGLNLVEAFNLN
ncbi:MAG TPA: hypothetical protein PLF13_02035 [candidate division Zixibacteria bacterium]|nr:hypothetical protein [candidate division Zixibacteria bacterium]